jgi:hypothetical protein
MFLQVLIFQIFLNFQNMASRGDTEQSHLIHKDMKMECKTLHGRLGARNGRLFMQFRKL